MRGFSPLATLRDDSGTTVVARPPAVRPGADRSSPGWRRTVARTCTIVGLGAAAWFATSLGSTAHADGLGSTVQLLRPCAVLDDVGIGHPAQEVDRAGNDRSV